MPQLFSTTVKSWCVDGASECTWGYCPCFGTCLRAHLLSGSMLQLASQSQFYLKCSLALRLFLISGEYWNWALLHAEFSFLPLDSVGAGGDVRETGFAGRVEEFVIVMVAFLPHHQSLGRQGGGDWAAERGKQSLLNSYSSSSDLIIKLSGLQKGAHMGLIIRQQS